MPSSRAWAGSPPKSWCWHPKTGLLTTHAPSTYKIPTANDCPPVFNVRLFEGQNFEDSIHRSKAVGEPPLLLPFSVFFAIRDAVSAAGEHKVDPPLRAPRHQRGDPERDHRGPVPAPDGPIPCDCRAV